jgi:hypothetical protein
MNSLQLRALTVAIALGISARALVGCEGDRAGTSLSTSRSAIVNGIPDTTAIPTGTYGCSAVLIAPRTILTAGHCFPQLTTNCATVAATFPNGIYFPETDGTVDGGNMNARTVPVIGATIHPNAGPDISGCSTTTTCQTGSVNCSDFTSCNPTTSPNAGIFGVVNRANDMAVLYLGADAPADMVPLQVVVDSSVADQSPRFVAFPQIVSWANAQKPMVTLVGSGSGTQQYGGIAGRDVGISQWVQTNINSFGTTWTGCSTSSTTPDQIAVRVSSPDLFFPWNGNDAGRPIVPPGMNVPDASSVSAGAGDSGGPVLIGDNGSTYQGRQATALPTPGTGATYALNTRYVAGIAEWNNTFTDSAGTHASDSYAATFNVSNSQFLAGALVDGDGDTLPDGADPFPSCVSNSDVDGDGTCDEEDDCECDPNQQDRNTTGDSDGVCGCDPAACGSTCTGGSFDNCPLVANAGQENCNEDAELALGATRAGDACDDTPCAETSTAQVQLRGSIASSACNSPLAATSCSVTVAAGIRWRGVVRSPLGQDGATRFAHCNCSRARSTPEQRTANCQFSDLGATQCRMGAGNLFPVPGTTVPTSGWRASTTVTPKALRAPSSGFSTRVPIDMRDLGRAGLLFDPASAPTALGAEHPTGSYAITGSSIQNTRWVFDQDLGALGVSFTPPSGGVSVSTQLTTLASSLRGLGWAWTSRFAGVAVTGSRADRASNYFVQDLNPRTNIDLPPVPPIITLPPFGPRFDPPCLSCPDFRPPWIIFDDLGRINPGDLIGIGPNGPGVVNPGFGSAIDDLFRDVGNRTTFVTPSEPGGTRGIRDLGAFMDSASGAIKRFTVDSDGDLAATPVGVPPVIRAVGEVAAFSGGKSELYLVRSGGTSAALLRVIDTRAETLTEASLSGVGVGVPVAVTYRAEDDALYVADRLAGGALRVLRVQRNGAAVELGRVNNPGTERTVIHLTTAPGGKILLTASGTASVHALYLVLVPEPTTIRVARYLIDARPGSLLTAPSVLAGAFAVARRTPVTPFLLGEVAEQDMLPLALIPLASTETYFKQRSLSDACGFGNVSANNDCTAIRSLALYASRQLTVADRASIRKAPGVYSPIANGGTGVTTIGADTQIGSVFTKGAFTLRDRGRVNGFVRGSAGVTLMSGATVSGTVLSSAPVNVQPLAGFALEFPGVTSGDVSLEPPPNAGSVLALAPGHYGDAVAKSRTRLSIRSGVYSFSSLTIEPDAVVAVDTSAGPVFVYVRDTFRFRGRIENTSGPRADLLVASFGTGSVFLEAPFVGTVVAPNAGIVLATVSAGHIGSFFGKDIELRPQTNVVHEPFNYSWVP